MNEQFDVIVRCRRQQIGTPDETADVWEVWLGEELQNAGIRDEEGPVANAKQLAAARGHRPVWLIGEDGRPKRIV
jgi:hypothetical protein